MEASRTYIVVLDFDGIASKGLPHISLFHKFYNWINNPIDVLTEPKGVWQHLTRAQLYDHGFLFQVSVARLGPRSVDQDIPLRSPAIAHTSIVRKNISHRSSHSLNFSLGDD